MYWCHQRGHEYSVHYGMVDEQFSDAVVIDYIVPRERRRVDEINKDAIFDKINNLVEEELGNKPSSHFTDMYEAISESLRDLV